MTAKELLDALAVDAQLLFNRQKDRHQAERQLAFGLNGGRAAAQGSRPGKGFQPAGPAVGAPQTAGVQEVLESGVYRPVAAPGAWGSAAKSSSWRAYSSR